MLREITEPVDLCRPDGRLNPAAVGWTRTPLHRPNLPTGPVGGWGRNKRWEYWGLVTPTHVVGLTVSSLDYAGVEAVYVLDRANGREVVEEVTVPLGRGVELTARAGDGPVVVHLRFALAHVRGGRGRHPATGTHRRGWSSTSWPRARTGTSRWAWSCRGATAASSTPSRTWPGRCPAR